MALLSDKINGVKTIIGLQSPAKAGFLQSYGGVTAPSGWLACDGTAVSRTTYSQLFANIGTKYGVGDGSTTFNLPSGPSSTYEVDNSVLDVVTASSALTGKVIGVTAISAISYQDSNGKHWLRFAGEVTTASSITGRMKFTGVDMGVDAAGISAADVAGALAMKISAKEKTVNNLFWSLVSGTGTIWGVSGDISIVSKPDWHDANIESTTIIKSFNDEAKGVTVGIAPATESESGTVTLSQLSSGTTNYVTNGDFEASITTGVSLTTLDSSSETTDPLFDTTSLKLTSQASAGVADFEIAGIDNGVIEAGVTTQVSAYLKTDSAVAEGDWTVGVYNVTDASYATSQTDLKVDSINIHRTPFVPLAAKVYVLRVEFVDTVATRDLVVDKIVMTPDSNSGLIETSDELLVQQLSVSDFTVSTGLSAVHGNVSMKRLGSSLDISVTAHFTGGSTDAGIFRFVLPEYQGETLNILQGRYPGGSLQKDTQAAGNNQTLYLLTGSDTDTGLSFSTQAAPGTALVGTDFGAGANEITNITFSAIIPITNWQNQGKVNLLTQEVVTANARCRYQMPSTSVIANGSTVTGTPALYSTLDYAESGLSYDSSTGEILFPSTGKYNIQMTYTIAALSQLNHYYLRTGSATGTIIYGFTGVSQNGGDAVSFTTTQELTVGTQYFLTINTANGGGSTSGDISTSNLSISRQQDYGAFDPAGFALATETQYGLLRKGLWATKTQFGALDPGTMNALTFSNLVEGRTYRYAVSGYVQSNAGGSNGYGIKLVAGSTDITENQQLASITDGNAGGFNIEATFVATSSLNECHIVLLDEVGVSFIRAQSWLYDLPWLGAETTIYD